MNNSCEGDSEESDIRSSDKYQITANKSSSANKPGSSRNISSLNYGDRLSNTKSNPNLHDSSTGIKKFNRLRVASETFLNTEQTMDVDDFIEEVQNDSVAFTNDSPSCKP